MSHKKIEKSPKIYLYQDETRTSISDEWHDISPHGAFYSHFLPPRMLTPPKLCRCNVPRASRGRFIFFTTFFFVCSGETLKVHKSTRMSCYFPKQLVKSPTGTSTAREKLHDDPKLSNKLGCVNIVL